MEGVQTMTDAEIVKLAVEKVLGLVKVSKPFPLEGEFIIVPSSWEGRGLYIHPSRMFNPLYSISDAWMLVEKLIVRGYTFKVTVNKYNAVATFFADDEGTPTSWQAHNRGHPHAITIAALRAVGEKV